MKRISKFVLAGIGAMFVLSSVAFATPFTPTRGSAVVDGNFSEWNLAQDFFSAMYRAGNPDKDLESRVYLRYDCLTSTLYVLVLGETGVPGLKQPADAWVAVDLVNDKRVNGSSGNDGFPADFAWVGEGFDGDPTHVRGYEAAFLLYEGVYHTLAHLEVFDDGEAQTSATPSSPKSGPELEIVCGTTPAAPVTWSRLKQQYR